MNFVYRFSDIHRCELVVQYWRTIQMNFSDELYAKPLSTWTCKPLNVQFNWSGYTPILLSFSSLDDAHAPSFTVTSTHHFGASRLRPVPSVFHLRLKGRPYIMSSRCELRRLTQWWHVITIPFWRWIRHVGHLNLGLNWNGRLTCFRNERAIYWKPPVRDFGHLSMHYFRHRWWVLYW